MPELVNFAELVVNKSMLGYVNGCCLICIVTFDDIN